MNNFKPLGTEDEVIKALDELFEEIEFEDSELDELLVELGYDPNLLVSTIESIVQNELAKSPLNWRNQHNRLEEERHRLESKHSNSFLGRQEIISAIQNLLGRLNVNQQQAFAHYRNLEHASDDDLASLYSELQFLAENDINSESDE